MVIAFPAPRRGDTLPADDKVHDRVYEALAEALIQGRIAPSQSVSLRSLAADLNVSAMPVREAVRRLIAEKALELQPSNKRLRVPDLTEGRLRQLLQAREWVESELAARAAGRLSREAMRRLREDDEALMAALGGGDVSGYMRANHDFHFTIYAHAGADLFHDMARTLWLQAGPFMRVVFGRLGTVSLPKDHHQDMIRALESGDAEGARLSMTADIREGMELMLQAMTPVNDRRR
jgi:DNA-binding GntR family transcriptional regulator